jgi:hypothetical protein
MKMNNFNDILDSSNELDSCSSLSLFNSDSSSALSMSTSESNDSLYFMDPLEEIESIDIPIEMNSLIEFYFNFVDTDDLESYYNREREYSDEESCDQKDTDYSLDYL